MQTRHGVIPGQQRCLTCIDLCEAAFDLRGPCIFGVCIDVTVEALDEPRFDVELEFDLNTGAPRSEKD